LLFVKQGDSLLDDLSDRFSLGACLFFFFFFFCIYYLSKVSEKDIEHSLIQNHEQGPILEKEEKHIGVAVGVQALAWFDVVSFGQDAHSGTTPPYHRKDALVAAARIITLVDEIMRMRGNDGRGTVGQLNVIPKSRNVIPSQVRFSVDFRHYDTAELAKMKEEFTTRAAALLADTGCTIEITEIMTTDYTPFDAECLSLVRKAAEKRKLSYRQIVSGAGHDAVFVSKAGIPTAMIFTPCQDGLSHNELESITQQQAADGCQVLFDAALAK
jgi:beta-ureidopropionase / N-carbamoyl-L-amino-acid hydrolase